MLDKATAIKDQLSDWRRDFHMHPELGFRETRTSAKVAEILEQFGYRLKRGVGRTGVVAELGSGKPLVAIRADMDALPLQEANQVPYASQNPGVMHACGHDSHMAMALGAAALLSREKFPGTVRFLFQPSEEDADEEGLSGAPRMVQDGAMDGVELVIAMHVEPTTPVGAIRIRSGPASGGVDSWFGEIIGTGGHGAHPHQTIDPFYITAHVILALNGIVSRRLDPFDPAVVSVGSLHGGFTENVIPERVKLTGTLRYTEKRVQEQIHAEIRRAFELACTLGGDYELEFQIGTPPMINSPLASDLIAAVAVDLLGRQNVLPWKDEMGAEDFGCFMELAPGAMFALGTWSGRFQCHLHNPDFDLDESCLPVGAAILAETALRFLRKKFD
ncbi:MAG TPA: M20 family metallopeptidase [Anaerolineales bacterium]